MSEKLKLTDKQETFVRSLIEGLSQRKAYRAAYPKSEKWTDSAVDSKACSLLKIDKVMARYNELKELADSEAILNRTDRMIMLSNMAKDEEMKPGVRIKAIDTLNKMDGGYVNKVELTSADDDSIKAMEQYFADKKSNT